MSRIPTRTAVVVAVALGLGLSARPAAAAGVDAAALYKAKCAACHGADGKGQAAAAKKMGSPDLTSHLLKRRSDADLFRAAKDGKGKMPGFAGKLTDDQLEAVLRYVRGLR